MAPAPHRMTGQVISSTFANRLLISVSVALVTGAASGIGRATTHTFVREGCTRLVIADLNIDGLKTVSEELSSLDDNVQTCLVECDVSVEADVQRMLDEGVKAFGAIHYAVNNAGVSGKPRLRTHELEVESYDRVQNINLRGLWLCERAELRQFLKQEPELKPRYFVPSTGMKSSKPLTPV